MQGGSNFHGVARTRRGVVSTATHARMPITSVCRVHLLGPPSIAALTARGLTSNEMGGYYDGMKHTPLVFLAVAALTACSPQVPNNHPGPQERASATQVIPSSAPSSLAPTAAPSSSLPSRPPTRAVVDDPAGNATGALDLTNVRLTKTGGNLRVAWSLAAPVPDMGLAGFYLSVASPSGDQAGQLGVKIQDGQIIGHFVFLGDSNVNLSAPPTIKGNTMTADFPLDELKPLGSYMKWAATVTHEGSDSDNVPDPGDGTLPNTYSFDL